RTGKSAAALDLASQGRRRTAAARLRAQRRNWSAGSARAFAQPGSAARPAPQPESGLTVNARLPYACARANRALIQTGATGHRLVCTRSEERRVGKGGQA